MKASQAKSTMLSRHKSPLLVVLHTTTIPTSNALNLRDKENQGALVTTTTTSAQHKYNV